MGEGTAVLDTKVSYNQPSGPNPRTTAYGGSKKRESRHGCTRHHGIIHSTERGGGGDRHTFARLNAPQSICNVMTHTTAGAGRGSSEREHG